MAGLDKIIAQIRSQSQEAADQTLTQAKAQAEEILKEARTQAEAECLAMEKKSRELADSILERGRSAAALDRRRRILEQKQELIGQVLQEAKARLKDMPQDQYAQLLIRLAVREARPCEGGILVSEADKKKLPQDFEKKLNKALEQEGRAGAKLSLLPGTGDMGAGFVLVYDGIEENCSFDAMFDAAHEALQDTAAKILFGGD